MFIQASRGGDIVEKRAQGNLTTAWSRAASLSPLPIYDYFNSLIYNLLDFSLHQLTLRCMLFFFLKRKTAFVFWHVNSPINSRAQTLVPGC